MARCHLPPTSNLAYTMIHAGQAGWLLSAAGRGNTPEGILLFLLMQGRCLEGRPSYRGQIRLQFFTTDGKFSFQAVRVIHTVCSRSNSFCLRVPLTKNCAGLLAPSERASLACIAAVSIYAVPEGKALLYCRHCGRIRHCTTSRCVHRTSITTATHNSNQKTRAQQELMASNQLGMQQRDSTGIEVLRADAWRVNSHLMGP